MKIELLQKFLDGELYYFWFIDDVLVSVDGGHKTLDDAQLWFEHSDYCNDEAYISREENRRYREKGFDRRSHKDRRDRYTHRDRRSHSYGRRWYEQIDRHKD